MTCLSPTAQDALGELFNLAVGQAGALLSEMAGREVMLSVPMVQVCHREETTVALSEQVSSRVALVSQALQGQLQGNACLAFADEDTLSLVSLLLRDHDASVDVTELEVDALSEVGNVLLNACVATLTSQLGLQVDMGLPKWQRGQLDRVLSGAPAEGVGSC